jgi:mono/diheme cytochrome c family protein
MRSHSHHTTGFALVTGLGLGICGILLGTGGPTRPGENVVAAAEPPARGPAVPSEDVAKVIVPFVREHCAHCHGPKKPEAELSLHAFVDEESILKERKTWVRVLVQVRAREMPPKGRPRPKEEDVERFTKAVMDLFERRDRTAPRDPGIVTIRRLNRAEYVNTIRDLVGVTIPLGDDFPADQTGHGFDNVGDILTLSPLQLERYLASAEAIMKAAIVVGKAPTPPTQRASGTHKFQGTPYGPRYDDRGRIQRDDKGKTIPEKERLPVIAGDSWRAFYDKGPFQKRLLDLETAGEYQVTARMQALPAGEEAPKFAILVNGKEVLRGTGTDKPEEHTASVRLKPGELRVGVSLLNEWTEPKDGTKRRGIVLHSISITGPTSLASHEMLLAGSEKLQGDAKSRHVLERFTSRAFRRPATKEEIDRLMKLVGQAEKIQWLRLSDESFERMQKAKVPQNVINNLKPLAKVDASDQDAFVKAVRGRLNDELFATHQVAILDAADRTPQPWEACIALAMRAVLCSPKFLYRAELDSRPAGKEPQPLDDYALASRLSYFLWSSMPDQDLFDLAAKKQLHQNLPAQVKRMMADPRSGALFDNFATQWLGLRRLQEFTPGPQMMPDFSKIRGRGTWADLRNDMLTETGLFFNEIVRENHSIFDLIDARFTYVNQRLADLYDIGDTNGNSAQPKAKPINPRGEPIPSIELLESGQDSGTVVRSHNPFVRVTQDNTRRGGLLTQASVLAVTSHPTRTSPVKRGAWVMERLLGTPPPPPPPDVPELGAKKEVQATTLRKQMELHRKNTNCAGCHARIDPIGFAFENFDVVGRFREKDGDAAVDPAGELPDGQKFTGPDELKAILKGKKELFSRNLAEKLLVYATGRGLDYYDRRTVDSILAELQKHDDRFQALISAIVQSDAFRLRRGKDQP